MYFRRLLFVLTFFTLTGSVKSQVGYLFGDLLINMVTTWEEGSYEVKYTTLNNDPLFMHGIRGGWYVGGDEKSLLGMSMVFGYASIKEYSIKQRQQIAMFYSTMYYEYNIPLRSRLEVSPMMHIGYGAVTIDQYLASSDNNYSGFFIAEPNVNLNFRLFPIIKIGIGAGYRLLSGVNLIGGDNISLSGLSANIFVKLGNFRHEE